MKKIIKLTEQDLTNIVKRVIRESEFYSDDEGVRDELDFDQIESYLKEHGWGDLPYERFIDFEKSDYYSGTLNSRYYAIEMDKYMIDLSLGNIN